MKYTKSVETIYTTTDYESFVFTDWNRNVSNARVVKMVESIKQVGWLPAPVMVNEKFEVIDGQSRVKALEKLGMPVQFCIKKGIGRKECQTLNQFQKNWATTDFINSYVADGNEHYIWIKDMLSKYKALTPRLVLNVIAAKGNGSSFDGGGYAPRINSGEMTFTDKEKSYIDNMFFYFMRFNETIEVIGGRKGIFYSALAFLYHLDVIDKERICTVINKARYDLVPAGTVGGWLQQIEDMYNKKLAKANKIDVMHEYKVAA